MRIAQNSDAEIAIASTEDIDGLFPVGLDMSRSYVQDR